LVAAAGKKTRNSGAIQLNRAYEEFDALWTDFLKTVEAQLLEPDSTIKVLGPTLYGRIIRSELDHWFQPEHVRGAWTQAFSAARPETAATLRQRLAEIRPPNRVFRMRRPWAAALGYAAGAAAVFLAPDWAFNWSIPILATKLALLLLILPTAAGVANWIRRKRRREAVRLICAALEREGTELKKILEDP
jgi:hypothetical protein